MSGTVWRVQKLGYSRSPWRIVDDAGTQITFESRVVSLQRGDELLPVLGYDSKAEAVEALGRLAASLYRRLCEAQP